MTGRPASRPNTSVRLGDLLKNGDIRANVKLEPGDVIIIPTSMF